MTRTTIVLLLLLAMAPARYAAAQATAAAPAPSQPPTPHIAVPSIPVHVLERWPDRDRITARLADLQRISTPEGIDVQEQVEIGGARQWISIRGQNRANPVLLVIHGGPGTPMTPMSWAYQKPWEDYFTVVNWDQRGVGKNAATADAAKLAPTVTIARSVADAEEVTAWVRKRLAKDKVVVLGYSWGSLVGAKLAMRRPEWLSAYVGVGQFVDAGDEAYLYRRTLALARAHGDADTVKALEALAPYPNPHGETSIEAKTAVRQSVSRYDGGWYGHPDLFSFYLLADWSPAYTAAEADAWPDANGWDGRLLGPELEHVALDREPADYRVPFFLFQGRYDLFTPYAVAAAYFDKVRAPYKKMETFERGAHFLMFEEPGRFLVRLVEDVLPVAGGRVEFAKGPNTP